MEKPKTKAIVVELEQNDAEMYEPEDEDINYKGEDYILRDGRIVFNNSGEIVGTMENGEITFT